MTENNIDLTYPEVKAGAEVKIHQEITDVNSKGEEKKRIQIFEGVVLQRRHGKSPSATITVRKVSDGIGVERIFPLRLPTIKKIEVVRQYKTNRAKLSFMRDPHHKMKELHK